MTALLGSSGVGSRRRRRRTADHGDRAALAGHSSFPSVGVTASQLPGFLSHSQQDLLDLVIQRSTDDQQLEFSTVAVVKTVLDAE